MHSDVTAYFAPLSKPMIAQVLSQQHLSLDTQLHSILQEVQGQWRESIQRVQHTTTLVYQLMTPVVEQQKLSTQWLLEHIALDSPQHRRLSHETISRWREGGLLSYHTHNRPQPDSVAALLILRKLFPNKVKGWVPSDSLHPDEPHWWCWRQDSLTAPIISCPFPLPQDIPPSALLWTTWAGAAWHPEWQPIGQLGAARWAGVTLQKDRTTLWNITEEHIATWDPAIIPLGEGLYHSAPLILHTLATLSLLRLATQRLNEYHFSTPL